MRTPYDWHSGICPEEIANDAFGGRSFVFVLVPTAGEGGMRLAENRERIQNVDELLSSGFPGSQVLSLDALLKRFTNPDALARIVELLETAPDETRRRYISKDGAQMMVALRTPSHQSILETRAQLDGMKTILSELPYSEEIVVTGFPVLLAQEFTALVEQMRQSLLIAVALAVAMIGLSTRSIKLALVSAIPNLLPILLVEGMLFIRGGYINITEVVALTIAFGIAIDNAVHVINAFRVERNTGVSEREALRLAIQEVGPALASSTLIICAAVAVMLTSSLPTIPVIGGLIIIILVIALVSNLLVLPATILSLAPNRDNA